MEAQAAAREGRIALVRHNARAIARARGVPVVRRDDRVTRAAWRRWGIPNACHALDVPTFGIDAVIYVDDDAEGVWRLVVLPDHRGRA